ncbi:MAG: methyltransferase family protein [Candidatus Binataceae bacterium]
MDSRGQTQTSGSDGAEALRIGASHRALDYVRQHVLKLYTVTTGGSAVHRVVATAAATHREATHRLAASAPGVTVGGLQRALGNSAIALMFLLSALPSATSHRAGEFANVVWMSGCLVMAILTLVRVAPKSVNVSAETIVASGGMLILPALMRPVAAAAGLMGIFGLVLEFVGIIFSQYARIQMGRRFGILPANRGIVTGGPFRLVRHPVYFGWFVLALGYALSYPSPRNFAMIILTVPLMFWRIRQEEKLLSQDSEYRSYRERVPYVVFPALM